MHNLDAITKEVMYLRLAGELQFSEIAAIMGKTSFYRLKEHIKDCLQRNKSFLRLMTM